MRRIRGVNNSDMQFIQVMVLLLLLIWSNIRPLLGGSWTSATSQCRACSCNKELLLDILVPCSHGSVLLGSTDPSEQLSSHASLHLGLGAAYGYRGLREGRDASKLPSLSAYFLPRSVVLLLQFLWKGEEVKQVRKHQKVWFPNSAVLVVHLCELYYIHLEKVI